VTVVPRFGDPALDVFRASAVSVYDYDERAGRSRRAGAKRTERVTVRNPGTRKRWRQEHKILIFSQSVVLLDLIQQHVLSPLATSLSQPFRFARMDGGTLFLDEIGDMSPEMQKKLLRVLQEGEFRVVGSDRRVTVDVRVIAASHHDLEQMVREGAFREDLYYRIAVLAVRLPNLRERRDDIPLLAEHLLARAAREAGRPVPLLPHDVMASLIAYDWPGNVRELENEMRRLVVLTEDMVRLEHLSTSVREGRGIEGDSSAAAAAAVSNGDIREAVADLEKRSIEAALAQHAGNKSRAAANLGISRFALQRKLEKYGFGKNDSADAAEDAGD
jgi:two-component system response regulator HupR/HoxA